jgi:hypothetical protein
MLSELVLSSFKSRFSRFFPMVWMPCLREVTLAFLLLLVMEQENAND